LNATNVIYQRFFSVGWFAQDDWKVSPKLTLNMGLRYGANQPIKEKRNRLSKFSLEQGKLVIAGRDGQPETLYDWDLNNFAPRFGFAWTPLGSKTVLRGGYGVVYDTKLTNDFTGMSLNTPFRALYVFQNAAGQAPAFTLNGLFPANLSTAPQSTLAVNGVQQKFPDGYSQQWSFNVQREVAGSLMVELAYVGSKGTKLDHGYNPNQPGPGTAAQIQARRPYPQYSTMTYRIGVPSVVSSSSDIWTIRD